MQQGSSDRLNPVLGVGRNKKEVLLTLLLGMMHCFKSSDWLIKQYIVVTQVKWLHKV